MVYFVTNQKNIQGYPLNSDILLSNVEDSLEYLWKQQIIGADSETSGFDNYQHDLLLFQLGNADRQYVIDCTTVDLKRYKRLLEEKMIILHHSLFDLRFLFHQGIIPFRNVYDTYVCEKLLHLGINSHKASLDACTRRYFKKSLKKEVRGLIHRLGIYNSRVIKYAAEDVEYLPGIREKQLRQAEEKGLLNTFSFENVFTTVLSYVKYCGIKIDAEKWKEKSNFDKKKLDEVEEKLNGELQSLGFKEFIGQPDLFNPIPRAHINWNSSEQVVKLFLKLGLNLKTVDKKTKKEKYSVESTVIKPQKDKHKIIPLYLEYKEKQKLVSTYGYTFFKHINPVTGRIHTSFKQNISTGRLSSGKDDDKNGKPGEINLQNITSIPDDKFKEEGKIYERECFGAKKGNILVVADYTAQETKILAYKANDPVYTDFILDPDKDMHSFNASLLYPELKGLSHKEIKKLHPSKRQEAKSISFAIPYGGDGFTIANNLSISIDRGKAIYEAYLNSFPGLKKYWERSKQQALDNGYILISEITGRKSYYPFSEQYAAIKERLESMVSGYKSGGKFQGLSSEFWKFYSHHKNKETDLFNESLRPLVKDYFQMRSKMGKKALNFPIQGTGAEMTKFAMIKVFDYIVNNNLFGVWLMPITLHDEIGLEVTESDSKEAAKQLQRCMEESAEFFCPGIGIKANPVITKYWNH